MKKGLMTSKKYNIEIWRKETKIKGNIFPVMFWHTFNFVYKVLK